MWANLKKDFRRIFASYLRAAATTVGGVQAFDAWGARGWNGVAVGLLLALIAPTIRGLESIAKTVDPDA